ncbi:NAD(P)H-hydrate epimerase [Salinibacterium sp. NSLL150]|nr:NAD(P)H-hydrate epimerase [Salinibacterium sp. NSLL35]MBH0100272.1 NAD(P)H-hydrate epimerase [Salinibacterium sp. NSLL150]MBH0103031.1 NAD(P)H-hydrate epimerase [Salinibacterium sp. NSLL16]MBH0105792.1 NAD(P)H-hydrate epimerase [Salinibacterium sp. NSLL17]
MAASSFRTKTGLVVPAITRTQMREVDRVAVEELGPNLYQMMENAGRNLASLCVELLGDRWPSAPIMVLAGTGGNGGGGICAARHLANHGGNVTLVISNPSHLKGVPADQLALYRATGARVATVADLDTVDADLLVDAVLGYSLGGAPHGAAAELIRWMSRHPAPVVSLDIPSGVDSTTGVAPGDHVTATHTMTLAAPKTGLDAEAVGALWLADIGIPREVYRRVGIELPPALFAPGYRVRLRAS